MGKSAVTGACGSGMAITHPTDTECHYATAEAECHAIEEHSRLVCHLPSGQEMLLKSGDIITLDGASGIVYNGNMFDSYLHKANPNLTPLNHFIF